MPPLVEYRSKTRGGINSLVWIDRVPTKPNKKPGSNIKNGEPYTNQASQVEEVS